LSDDEPVFTPSKFAEHEAQVHGMKREETRIPPQLIIVYSSRYLKYLQKSHTAKQLSGGIIDKDLCVLVTIGTNLSHFYATGSVHLQQA